MELLQRQASADDASRVWLPAIKAAIARFLSPNEIAYILRLIDRSTSEQFAGFTAVRLSLATPPEEFKRRWGSPDPFRSLTRKQRLKVICLTAASGCLENLEVALSNAGLVPGREVLEAAAGAGQLEAVKLLRERYGCPWGIALFVAARGGHRHMCEWALACGAQLTPEAAYAAARGGHEDLMLWLLERLRDGNDGAQNVTEWELMSAAAEGLSLVAFQRLYHQYPGGVGGKEARVLAGAAASPTPDWQAKVEWLEGLGYTRTLFACIEVVRSGEGGDTVGRLQWLHARGYPMSEVAAEDAALSGDLAALHFLVEQAGMRQDVNSEARVAERGHLSVLQYLHGGGHHFNAGLVARFAARGGHLPVVVWAVETLGLTPRTEGELFDFAAESGSVALMAWLEERGWGWGGWAVIKVALSGCVEALEWLLADGYLWSRDALIYAEVARHGDLAMIRALHRLGCPWGDEHVLLYGADGIGGAHPAARLACQLRASARNHWPWRTGLQLSCASVPPRKPPTSGYRVAQLSAPRRAREA